MRSWVDLCIHNHGTKCEPNDTKTMLPAEFRAIDTNLFCVVELPSSPTPRFVALSYRWDPPSGTKRLQLEQANLAKLRQRGALASNDTPALFLDVIRLYRDLGEPCLWIDQICIVQDDHISKQSQIQAMDRIYAMATFTIVIALQGSSSSGLPGVKGRPRRSSLWNTTRVFSDKSRVLHSNFHNTVTNSVWNTRGWTFQELSLSLRCIYITEFQTYFSCIRTCEQEELGEIAATPKLAPYSIATYAHTVNEYTSRNLSFESDILNVFAGVGNQFVRTQGGRLLYGLPEKYLTQALLWENFESTQRRKDVPDIPSWSWAAWSGRTGYDSNPSVQNMRVGTPVRFSFQHPDLGLCSLDTDECWFSTAMSLKNLKKLPSIDELYPKMRFMPGSDSTNAVWSDCPHNPWETSTRTIDRDACKLGSKYPGGLVFTSTTAFLSLRVRQSPQDSRFPNSSRLDIVDDNGVEAGQTVWMDRPWIVAEFDLAKKHEFVVLSAGVLSEFEMYALLNLGPQTSRQSGNENGHGLQDAGLWYLHVVLIERDVSDRVARRVGVGAIKTGCWKQCNPTWSTVVLT